MKTTTANMRDFRRPTLSPTGAASRAPKKVPALSIDTISDDCVGVMASRPSSSLLPVEKLSSHHRIAMMPLIVLEVPKSVHVLPASLAHSAYPVSYPKSMPPNATKAPIMIAGAEEPAALSGFRHAVKSNTTIVAVLRRRSGRSCVSRKE